MNFREIGIDDIPALFQVRISTDENNISLEDLKALDITESSVKAKMERTYKGWLCDIENQIVGFAKGDESAGELWVIAVLPEYICNDLRYMKKKLVYSLFPSNIL